MGLFDDVVKKVKSTVSSVVGGVSDFVSNLYSKADTALGGYLPGSSTPQEVSLSQRASQISNEPNFQPASGGPPTYVPPPRSVTSNLADQREQRENVDIIRRINESRESPEPNLSTPTGPEFVPPPQEQVQQPGVPEGFTREGNQLVPIKEPTFLQKASNLLFGNYLTSNPLTGAVYLDPETGQPVKAISNVVPFGTGGVGAGAKAVQALGTADDYALAAKNYGNVAKAFETIAKFERTGNSLVNTGGKVGNVAKAASGVTQTLGSGGVAVNTATAATKINWISKASKSALWVLGIVGTWVTTGVFAQNEWGDAVQALSIAITSAEKQGDVDTANELKGYLDEITPERMEWYLGPIAYVGNVGKKIEAGIKIAEESTERIKENEEKRIADEIMAGKIEAGLATEEEIRKYVEENPFSEAAIIYQQQLKGEEYRRQAIETQQQLENIKTQGALQRNAIYQGGGSGPQQREFLLPSSLNFGLLRTPGGYKQGDELTTDENAPIVDKQTYTQNVATYIYGIPYSQLTPNQRAVVDAIANTNYETQ